MCKSIVHACVFLLTTYLSTCGTCILVLVGVECDRHNLQPSSSQYTPIHVAQEAPHLLLCGPTCAALSACCKQANRLVHHHYCNKAFIITVPEASCLKTVVSRKWPCLVVIVLLKQLWRAAKRRQSGASCSNTRGWAQGWGKTYNHHTILVVRPMPHL